MPKPLTSLTFFLAPSWRQVLFFNVTGGTRMEFSCFWRRRIPLCSNHWWSILGRNTTEIIGNKEFQENKYSSWSQQRWGTFFHYLLSNRSLQEWGKCLCNKVRKNKHCQHMSSTTYFELFLYKKPFNNDHLSTTATFLVPKGGWCTQFRLI